MTDNADAPNQTNQSTNNSVLRPTWTTEEYMVAPKEWRSIDGTLGPHNMDGCTRVDGLNCLKDQIGEPLRRCHEQDSFLAYSGKDDDSIFINPPFSEAQKFLDHGIEITNAHPNARWLKMVTTILSFVTITLYLFNLHR